MKEENEVPAEVNKRTEKFHSDLNNHRARKEVQALIPRGRDYLPGQWDNGLWSHCGLPKLAGQRAADGRERVGYWSSVL